MIFDEGLREMAHTFDVGTKVVVNGQMIPYIVEDIEGKKKKLLHIRPYSLFSCTWQWVSSTKNY